MSVHLRQIYAVCMLGTPNPIRAMTLIEHMTLWSPGKAFRREWYDRSRTAHVIGNVL